MKLVSDNLFYCHDHSLPAEASCFIKKKCAYTWHIDRTASKFTRSKALTDEYNHHAWIVWACLVPLHHVTRLPSHAKNPGKLKHLVLLLEHLGTNESDKIFFTYV